MALAYLLDPCLQHQNRAGVNNVSGYFEVFEYDTDDRATVYTDFEGTLAPAHIGIDNNGRCVMIVDSSKAYRVEMHLPNGDLVYTQSPVWTVVSGGGVISNKVEVESSDGSISVDKTVIGNVTTYDLSANVEDGTDLLEWIRCDGGTAQAGSDIVKPTYSAGTMLVGTTGVQVKANSYYHVTAHLRATKSDVDAYYDNVYVLFSLGNEPVTRQSVIIDYSMGLSQDFEVSTDVKVDADSELNLSIIGASNAGDVELLNMEMHRIYSGTPVIPGGVQRTLIAGANITIEHTGAGDVISSTGGGSGTTEYTSGTGIVVDNTEHTISVDNTVAMKSDLPDLTDYVTESELQTTLSDYATDTELSNGLATKQDTLTAGTGIDITNNVISCTTSFTQLQSNWNEQNPASVQYILNRPDLSQYATQTDLAGKQDVLTAGSNITISGSTISATDTTYSAGTGLSLSGNEFSVDSTVVAMKSDLPDLTDYVTDTELSTILQGYQEALTAGTNISISNGVISATDTTYSAGTGLSLNGTTFSVDTSTIATQSDLAGKQDTLTAGNGIDITSDVVSAKVDGSTITVNSNGELVATGSSVTQLQSDWEEQNTASVQYILHKPNTKPVVAGSNITITEGTNDITVACSVTVGTVTV